PPAALPRLPFTTLFRSLFRTLGQNRRYTSIAARPSTAEDRYVLATPQRVDRLTRNGTTRLATVDHQDCQRTIAKSRHPANRERGSIHTTRNLRRGPQWLQDRSP